MNYWIQEMRQSEDPDSDFMWRPAIHCPHGPYFSPSDAIQTRDEMAGKYTYRVIDDYANVIEYGKRTV